MTDQKAICAVQQLSEAIARNPDERVKFFPVMKDKIDTVLKLACKAAGLSYPQTGYRGGIIIEDEAA